jgi:hypothetical protein
MRGCDRPVVDATFIDASRVADERRRPITRASRVALESTPRASTR